MIFEKLNLVMQKSVNNIYSLDDLSEAEWKELFFSYHVVLFSIG